MNKRWMTIGGLVLGTACGGPSVSVEWIDGADTYAEAESALWLDVVRTYYEKGERFHAFQVTDGPGTCDDWREYFDATTAVLPTLMKDLNQYSNKSKGEAACERIKAGLGRLDDAAKALQVTTSLQLGVEGPDTAPGAPPADGTYVSRTEDPKAEWTYNGAIEVDALISLGDPLADVQCGTDDWYTVVAPAIEAAFYDNDDETRSYYTVGGKLMLTAVGDDAYDVELVDAPLVDLDQHPAGRIHVSGRFERCEIMVESGYGVAESASN